MEPPTARTVEPESTLEDVVIQPQSGLFTLPPPALSNDEDDDSLAVTDLAPEQELSVLGTETSDLVSKEECSGLIPSDILFSSLFGGRHIPGASKEAVPASLQRTVQPGGSPVSDLLSRSDVHNSSMLRHTSILHKGITT